MNILMSYWMLRQQAGGLPGFLSALNFEPSLWLDCGAFTANSQGAEINLDDYCDFIEENRERIAIFAALDVIGDAEASRDNWREHLARGQEAVPVFHAGEPWSMLEEYCEATDYVALGGMVPLSTDVAGRWLYRCFQLGEKYQARFHGFGQTSWPLLMDFPFWSVDSTSWLQIPRFGQIKLFDDRKGTWLIGGQVGDGAPVYEHGELIRRHGVEPEQLADSALYKDWIGAKVGAAAWSLAEAWLRKRHQVDPPTRGLNVDGLGTKMYLTAWPIEQQSKALNGTVIFLAGLTAGTRADGVAEGLAIGAKA